MIKNLKDIFSQATGIAHLIIDVRREYCDPSYLNGRGTPETALVSQKIEKAIPHIKNKGITTIFIYQDRYGLGPRKAGGGPYLIAPQEDDLSIPKNRTSAFSLKRGEGLDLLLQRKGIDTILVSGFNLNACVFSTVLDATYYDYKTLIITDLCGNDSLIRNPAAHYLEAMQNNEAILTKAKEVITALNTMHP